MNRPPWGAGRGQSIPPHIPRELPDPDAQADRNGVGALARAMESKLAAKRAEGYSGWNKPDECTVEHLARLLLDHIPKGDPVDIANFCMMLFNREGGAEALRVAAASPTEQSAKPRDENEKDQRIKELEEALRETLGIAELFVPVPLNAGGFKRARQALSTSRGEEGSSSANPSPLDATRHSSDETPAPSGPVRDAAKRLAHRTLEYIGWLNGSFGPPEILQSDAEMKDLALEVFRALGEPEPARVMRTKGKRP